MKEITRILGVTLFVACSDEPTPASVDASDESALDASEVSVDAAPPDARVDTIQADRSRDARIEEVVVAAPSYTPMGAPTWGVRCAQTSVPVPGDPQGYVQELGRFLTRAAGPEHRVSSPGLSIDRGEVHAPPYDDEAARFLARGGAPPTAVFVRPDVDDLGTYLVLCAVYALLDAQTGATPDGTSLPMIAAERFPIAITNEYALGARVVGVDRESLPVPVGAPFEGVSHFVLRYAMQFTFEPADRFPATCGFHLTLVDARGDGYRVALPFAVVDDTSS